MNAFIGHLHPVLVHLPIGILLLACFFQLLSAREKYIHLQHAISITLLWGMISAVVACITGYVLSNSGDYNDELVSKHQWFGISVAAVSIVYYVLYSRKVALRYTWLFPVVLIVLIAVTGHLGGSLTHGSDYLTGTFNSLTDTVVARKPIPDVQQAVAYTDIIQPLLQSKCYGCHGASKQKGKLRLDQPDLLMKGGKDGVVIEAGNAAESELLKRIVLEKADEHHMPPKEKPQLTEKEIALLHWWIATGASFTKKTKELGQTEKIQPALLSLQNSVAEKKEMPAVPGVPVEKAAEGDIKKLTDLGVVVIPVAGNSNYLEVSFVAAQKATDSTVQLLRALKKQIVWLQLSDTKITDASLPVIAACTHVTRLQMRNTAITDKGLSSLTGLDQLQLLNLVNTKVTAQGIMKLSGLRQLHALFFYHTGVQPADWSALHKAFPATVLDSGGYTVPLLATDTMLVKPPVVSK